MKSFVSVAVVAAVAGFATGSLAADWAPEKPLTVIVPWAAGGVTDQVIRTLAIDLKPVLGQDVVVVNQPGASGSIGTRAVLDAPHDGYSWASGGVRDLGTYAVVDMLDTRIEDWNLYIAASIGPLLSVNPDTPYETAADLIEAMKANPGQVRVATAGINSSGGQALGALSTAAGVEGEQVVYDGGNPAVLATVSGETDATTQLALEQAEMIRGGRLRPLAVIGSTPMQLEGYGEIPAITDVVPNLGPTENLLGVFLPGDVPDEVTAKLDAVWDETVTNSEGLATLCSTRGCGVLPLSGQAAQDATKPLIEAAAWGIFERNEHKVSPEDLGIARPAN